MIRDIPALADSGAEEVVAWRRDFHRHPELSHEERRTARVVADILARLGLEVRTGVAGHGVVARLRGGRPGLALAYRADMDALPLTEKARSPWRSEVEGVMHACGHDFHMAVALGAARVLSRLRERLAGEIRFIFQPAEEGPPRGDSSGARGMIAAGALDDPPVATIFGLHAAPGLETGSVRYCSGAAMAGTVYLRLSVAGKPAHGAVPYRGVDPVPIAAHALIQLKTMLTQELDARRPVVMTFGRIEGGKRFNILADKVELEGALRYHDEGARDKALAAARRHLAGLEQASGSRIALEARPFYPPLVNEPGLARRAAAILERALGAGRVAEHEPTMGSEDFAFFAQRVPAFYFSLGARAPGAPARSLHSEELDLDEAALSVGVKAAAALLASVGNQDSGVL